MKFNSLNVQRGHSENYFCDYDVIFLAREPLHQRFVANPDTRVCNSSVFPHTWSRKSDAPCLQAIKLDPTNAKAYYRRSLARHRQNSSFLLDLALKDMKRAR